MSAAAEQRKLVEEIREWFFENYLPRWVNAAAGTSADDSGFISQYWGHPLHAVGDALYGCLLREEDVVGFLHATHERLRIAGYRSHR